MECIIVKFIFIYNLFSTKLGKKCIILELLNNNNT